MHAWLDNQGAASDGIKYFGNLAGLPVGTSRLPRLPVSADDAANLDAGFADFCAEAAKQGQSLYMCRGQ